MFFGTLMGVIMLGITISWNLLTFEAYTVLKAILSAGTLVFQASFLIITITVQNMSSMWFLLDVVILVLSGLADWNHFGQNLWGKFGSVDLFVFIILTGYQVFRFWLTLLHLEYNPIRAANDQVHGAKVLDQVHLVWTTRSPELVSEIIPDLEDIWNGLVAKFGFDIASEFCEISIYCTSKDKDMCDQLRSEVKNTELYKIGCLKFNRPNFPQILEDNTAQRIVEEPMLPSSNTLFAFCGSPKLAEQIKEAKIMNDLARAASGVGHHQIALVAENYGGEMVISKQELKKQDANLLKGADKLFADDGNKVDFADEKSTQEMVAMKEEMFSSRMSLNQSAAYRGSLMLASIRL